MEDRRHIDRKLLLDALKRELAFFDAGGYGHPFRSAWRPTLLLRDSPVCINYGSTGRQHECRLCPLFSLVPWTEENAMMPCHHIPLNAARDTVAQLYQRGTQKVLDQHYRDWLLKLIREFQQDE